MPLKPTQMLLLGRKSPIKVSVIFKIIFKKFLMQGLHLPPRKFYFVNGPQRSVKIHTSRTNGEISSRHTLLAIQHRN